MPLLQIQDVPPEEAIQYLESRLANPVGTYSWQDVWQAEHARRFTVAKSSGYDVLGDISAALDDTLKNGGTFEDFTRNLIPALQDKGWWGTARAVDPLTGIEGDVQLGSLRRLRTIFDTNMRMSYAAGRWMQVQRVKSDRPYLRYVHTASEHPRHEHLQWVGTTLPVDDPWWSTHYPPNGWGCKCSTISLSQNQYDAMAKQGEIVTAAPAISWKQFTNNRTGETMIVPAGIDPGFGYNVGQAIIDALTGGG